MKRILLAAACVAVAAACTPDIKKDEKPAQVTARFDPSQTPPVVPTPNDLAFNPATGTLGVTPAPDATDADIEFTNYLNTLNGFPASSTATATFTGKLDPASVTTNTVRVFDITDPNAVAAVADATAVYADQDDASIPGKIEVTRPTGWQPGHSYLVAIVGGSNGVKGADGEPVVASSTFLFLKSENSLVTGCDLTVANADLSTCKSVTAAIPTSETIPAKQVEDRNAKAAQLEQLRLKYKPSVERMIAGGVSRGDLALLWTFGISDDAAIVFDPAAATPKVPRPNDLAISRTTGLVTAPIDPLATPAQQEFTSDYLNTLNGFPTSATATAEVAGGDLDPASVTADGIRVFDLTASPPEIVTGVTFSYDATKNILSITPPAGGWKKANQYAIALVSGLNADGDQIGLTDTAGVPVIASQVWALVRAAAPVDELTLVELAASQVQSLLGLQALHAPLVEAALADDETITRENIVLGWLFRTLNHPEATLDLTATPPVVPFPNSLAMKPDNSTLNLPNPTNNPLITGLNTLDGFSLTAPIVSENSITQGAFTDNARVDPASLGSNTDGGSWAILPLAGGAVQPPIVRACVNCATEPQTDGGVGLLPDGGTWPDQLQFIPVAPLAEKTTYAMALKTTAKDTTGRSVRPTGQFALLRMANPLVAGTNCDPTNVGTIGNCTSTVDGVSLLQAFALESRRLALKPVFDALTAAGHPRKDLAIGWTFRTQTVVNGTTAYPGLRELHNAGLAAPNTTDYLTDITAQIPSAVPKTAIAKFYQGSFRSPWLLTAATGTFGGAPRVDKVIFTLTIPTGTQPANGWPIVIFGHGLRSHRNTTFAITNTLASAGFATIFIDAPFHGDRSSCRGYAGQIPGVAAACATGTCDATSASSSATFGYCVGATRVTACTADTTCQGLGQGRCLNDGFCAGGDFVRGTDGAVAISGWNILDTVNLFATRDNFRQQVVDLGQLARVIAAPEATANTLNNRLATGEKVNGGAIHYGGISLGGILGTLYVASAPEVHRAVLNVPGGDPSGILLYAPAFAAQRTAFIASLATQGVVPGTPAYDQFLYFARTILDPADPSNAAWDMMNATTNPTDRAALIQYIDTDLVVPNIVTDKLIAAATRDGAPNATVKKAAVFKFNPTFTELPPAGRHSFLLSPTHPATTGAAQSQFATFLVTGAQP